MDPMFLKRQQEIMRQQAPRPQQIDVSNWRDLKCVCGSEKFLRTPIGLVKYDPLQPSMSATINLDTLSCLKCGMIPEFDKGTNEWTFKTGATDGEPD